MKLTHRQKKTVLVSALSFSLMLAVVISTILLVNSSQKKVSSPQKNAPLDDNLIQTKSEIITSLEQKLTANNIKDETFWQELKINHHLEAGENNLKEYINGGTTSAELEERKNILAVIEKLTQSGSTPPSPTPKAPPTPQPGPGIPTQSPPANQWERNLWEIENFLNSNPKTLSEIEKWLQDKNYDPLKGVNLAGVDLKGKSDNGKVSDLESLTILEQKHLATKYKDYVQLSAAGDGNCFLHTFSVFLTGDSNVDMTLRLRAAMCLELMKNAEIHFKTESSEEDKISALKKTIMSEKITKNGAWLNSDVTRFLAPVLKRPLLSIVRMPYKKGEKTRTEMYYYPFPNNSDTLASSRFQSIPDKYSEEWVVYNSGGHFQPLIKNIRVTF